MGRRGSEAGRERALTLRKRDPAVHGIPVTPGDGVFDGVDHAVCPHRGPKRGQRTRTDEEELTEALPRRRRSDDALARRGVHSVVSTDFEVATEERLECAVTAHAQQFDAAACPVLNEEVISEHGHM